MSDRTIAEIIGWERTDLGHWFIAGEGVSHMSRKPTVDDLLAFLSCDVFFQADLLRESTGLVSVKFRNTDSGLDGEYSEGPTLLAALSAAVCAVDSRSPVGGVADDGTTTDSGPQ